jgi:hypothetical protein
MFSVIILMCDLNRTSCWTYMSKSMFETRAVCEQVVSGTIKSDHMILLKNAGWIATDYRCVNWEEEMA